MGFKLTARLTVAAILASGCLIQGTAGQSVRAAPTNFAAPTVFIHYYDWYSAPPTSSQYGHWNGGDTSRPDPASNITSASYPLLGPYDSASPSQIKQQMAWLKMAHVDVLSLDWWGQGSLQDKLARSVMDGAAAQGLKVNFVIDTYTGETPASIGSDIAYIYRNYGSHPAFYRTIRPTKYGPSGSLRGVFMLYDPPPPKSLTDYSKLMDGIRGTSNDAIVLARIDDSVLFSDAAIRKGLDVLHMDGMFNYGPYGKADYQVALPQSNDYILMFSVAPGFDNSRAAGISSPVRVPRNNGITYDDAWSTLIGKRPEWIAVVSFNEWHETSQIEPARPFTYNGFRYLDYEGHYGLTGAAATTAYLVRTAYWADRFKGISGPVNATQNPITSPSLTPAGQIPASAPPAPAPPSLFLVLIVAVIIVAAGVILWRRRRH